MSWRHRPRHSAPRYRGRHRVGNTPWPTETIIVENVGIKMSVSDVLDGYPSKPTESWQVKPLSNRKVRTAEQRARDAAAYFADLRSEVGR